MHIAMVHRDLHEINRGGICTLYRALAAQLVGRGLRITLITQDTDHPVRIDGATVLTLPRTDDLGTHRKSVRTALDDLRPDVVECSTWEAETLDYLATPRPLRAPVLVRGEFSAATLGAQALAADEQLLVLRADQVVAVSRFAAGDLATAYGIPVPPVIYNGVDRTLYHPGPAALPASGSHVTLTHDGVPADHEPIAGSRVSPWGPDLAGRARLLWVGKITPMKGWDRLEQLARQLADIAVITVLLGHSPAFCPVLLDPSDATILQDVDQADLPGLYRSADWLLSTSRWEGFGLAIVEALACGTPVLLPADLGVAPELLSAGGGHTYDGTDQLRQLLLQPPPAASLPADFDWAVNADRTLCHYRALAGA